MDGFRFDLMGLMDAPLMEKIRAALDEKYGVGEKLVYGEPWSAGGTGCREGTVLCHKGQLKSLSPGIGAFTDDTRDAIKGGLMDEKAVGFCQRRQALRQQAEKLHHSMGGIRVPHPQPDHYLCLLP